MKFLFKFMCISAVVFLLFQANTEAFSDKEILNPLDEMVYQIPEMRVVQTISNVQDIRTAVPQLVAMDEMLAEMGPQWKILLDERTGRPSLIKGGAIPWIPGVRNDLNWEDIDASCAHNQCIPMEKVANLATQFLTRHAAVFGLESYDLVLVPKVRC